MPQNSPYNKNNIPRNQLRNFKNHPNRIYHALPKLQTPHRSSNTHSPIGNIHCCKKGRPHLLQPPRVLLALVLFNSRLPPFNNRYLNNFLEKRVPPHYNPRRRPPVAGALRNMSYLKRLLKCTEQTGLRSRTSLGLAVSNRSSISQ